MLTYLDKLAKPLCTPSVVYVTLSLLVLFSIVFENLIIGDNNSFVCGKHRSSIDKSCRVNGLAIQIIFIITKGMYIIFWAYILNMLCRNGYINVAWFFVIFPLTLTFVIIAVVMILLGVQKIDSINLPKCLEVLSE